MANDTRETRLRRMSKRQGFELIKSRRRDPRAIGYGRFCLVHRWSERVVGVATGGIGLVDAPVARGGRERFAAWVTLDTIERWLVDGMEKPGHLRQSAGLHSEATTRANNPRSHGL